MQIYDKHSYNAIIVQPGKQCQWYCQGCYFHKFAKRNNLKGYDIPEWMSEFALRVLRREGISANQLILSLNHTTFPDDCNYSGFLDKIYNGIYNYKANSFKTDTELHVTLGIQTVPVMKKLDRWELMNTMSDGISISIDDWKMRQPLEVELEKLGGPTKIPWNCNLLFTEGICKTFQNNDPLHIFKQLMGTFDTVYLVALKPALGDLYGVLHRDSVRTVINTYNSLPTEWKEKHVFMDRCVETCAKSRYGCEAGINLLTVWPNGSITACPYSTEPIKKDIEFVTVEQVIRNIHDMRRMVREDDNYDFNKCQMRNLW